MANDSSGNQIRVPTARHVVVLCHDVSTETAAGLFSVQNLLQGRLDLWCRCVTAGLYLSDDLRRDTVVSLVLSSPENGDGDNPEIPNASPKNRRVIQIRGDEIQGLAPAEARIALLLQRAAQHASLDVLCDIGERNIRATEGTSMSNASRPEKNEKNIGGFQKSSRNAEKRKRGWLAKRPGSKGKVPGIQVADYGSFEECLDALLGVGQITSDKLFLLDVNGVNFTAALKIKTEKSENPEIAPTTLVVGDAVGITDDERETLRSRNAIPVTLGPHILLASHCIVLAHAAMDAADDG